MESLYSTYGQSGVDAESGVIGAGNKSRSLLYIKKSIADASQLFEVETGYWKLSRSPIYRPQANSWLQCEFSKSSAQKSVKISFTTSYIVIPTQNEDELE